MKRELITTPLKRIRPVFANAGEGIKQYGQLRQYFTPEAATLFAEPIITGSLRDQITWYSEVPGQHRTLASLPAEERSRVLPLLNEQVNQLFRDLIRFVRNGNGQYDRTRYMALRRTVESALQVPAHDDILLFETPNGPRFVLINWGFTLDLDKAPRNLIQQLTPFAVTPVTLQATYLPTGEQAPNEPLQVRWEQQKLNVETDPEGRVYLPEVPFLSELIVSQVDATGNEANRQLVLVDERDPTLPYAVALRRLPFPMRFRVVDQRGNNVPNHPVRLVRQGQPIDLVADAAGLLMLADVCYGDSVDCHDRKDAKTPLARTHVFARNQAEYPIPIVIPDPLQPVKTGFRYMGCLALLLLLLFAGLVAWYYFAKKEKVLLTQETLVEAPKEVHKLEKAKCNDARNGMDYTSASGLNEITTEYDLGHAGGTFQFDYYTDSAPDQLEVFDGPAADLDKDSKPLFNYYGSTIGDFYTLDMVSERIRFKSRYVTVRVRGQTIWNYKVNCPLK
jgi:hypothetical protein